MKLIIVDRAIKIKDGARNYLSKHDVTLMTTESVPECAMLSQVA